MSIRVLVADDFQEFVNVAKAILTREKYEVHTAMSPDEALAKIASTHFDVVILDYRLRTGESGDRSGMEVAANTDPRLPKILVSDKADREEIMAAVRTGEDGMAVAVRFLSKQEIADDPAKLVHAVHAAVTIGRTWMRQKRDSFSTQLAKDYRAAATLAVLFNVLHLLANVAFVGLVVTTAIWLHAGYTQMLFTLIAALGGELMNVLLARGKGEALEARADRYHAELLQATRFEQLLSACDTISNPIESERARVKVIAAVTGNWMGANALTHAEENVPLRLTAT